VPETADRDGETFEFDCPECSFHIVGEVDRCPKCGVEFVIEEVTDDAVAEAPAEEAAEPVEAPAKEPADPEAALKEEFTALVDEVGPLMALAKDHGVETSVPRRLVDKAVAAGKRRDVAAAAATMRECRDALQQAIADRLERDIHQLEDLAEVAAKAGSDIGTLRQAIADAKARQAEGDIESAFRETADGKRLAESLTGPYVEAHELYEALERTVLNAERFYLDVREARRLLNEATEAGERADWTTMGILARKGREELARTLPEVLGAELRRAKQALFEAKAAGRDVTAMVKILKDAGVAAKRERYEEALERLIEFRDEEKA